MRAESRVFFLCHNLFGGARDGEVGWTKQKRHENFEVGGVVKGEASQGSAAGKFVGRGREAGRLA